MASYMSHVFGLGLVFAIWDAIGCGANDVANSFATAVNSKTLTMRQAMIIATAMEILGAMTLGSYNASTIRSGIINTVPFTDNGGALMLGMLCVVISSSTFNFLSNKFGWATSSTHAMIGALIGVGVASNAGVMWGYLVTTTNGSVTGQNGLGAVIASFVISPVLAGIIAALIYSVIKFVILRRSRTLSFTWALRSAPFWYAFVAAFEAWLIAWKSPRYPNVTDGQTLAIFFGTFGFVFLVTALFLCPYMYRKIWLGWSKLRLWHLPLMPLPESLVVRFAPGLNEKAAGWDDRHLTAVDDIPADDAWQWDQKDIKKVAIKRGLLPEPAKPAPDATIAVVPGAASAADSSESAEPSAHDSGTKATAPEAKPLSAWKQRKADFKVELAAAPSALAKVWVVAKFVFFIGVDRDIADHGTDREDVAELHDEAHAERWYGKTEQVFTFLQVLTSSVASFAHGANDVSLSVGPIATMYYYWQAGPRGNTPKSSVVNDWQLAVGGVSLVLGLWFYGYNMMRVLGNRLTFHSPSRGFSMELGSAIAVLIAARNGIPVSTTNCIVGATAGVGLMNGSLRAVNWKLLGKTMFLWAFTVPFCALLSGCVYALIAYSPKMACSPVVINTLGNAVLVNGANVTAAALKLYPAGC